MASGSGTGTPVSTVSDLIVSTEEADTYFETRRSSSEWFETGLDKDAELTTAQNQLALFYTLDETETKHKNSVCEQALFNIKYGDGIEDRLSQRLAGVTDAGLIKEGYNYKEAAGVVICPYALAALRSVSNAPRGSFFGAVDLVRDESA